MKCKSIYEFLVWDNCNNNCQFCWQRKNPRIFSKEIRIKSLESVINFIESDSFVHGSHVLIVGGEIFDKPTDMSFITNFYTSIVKFMIDGRVDLLYINTNLIYKDLTILTNVLDEISLNNLINRVRFTTSYDYYGRFKNESDRLLMLSNLSNIRKTYPDLSMVTNIILTKQMCNELFSESFSIKKYMNEYGCWVNLIPYIIYDKNLSANKNDVFRSLIKVDNENHGYLDRYIANLDLSQDKLLYKYENGNLKFCSCDYSSCGHSNNFKLYSTDNTCFICDLKELIYGNV